MYLVQGLFTESSWPPPSGIWNLDHRGCQCPSLDQLHGNKCFESSPIWRFDLNQHVQFANTSHRLHRDVHRNFDHREPIITGADQRPNVLDPGFPPDVDPNVAQNSSPGTFRSPVPSEAAGCLSKIGVDPPFAIGVHGPITKAIDEPIQLIERSSEFDLEQAPSTDPRRVDPIAMRMELILNLAKQFAVKPHFARGIE